MQITAFERDLVIALALGNVDPVDGMQRHFLRVVRDNARPITPKEHEWLAIWHEHQRSVAGAPVGLRPEPDEVCERICVDCGDPIPAARIAALPATIRCVLCQTAFEKINRPARFIDEGIGGTREDNKKERGRVWGDTVRRSKAP